MTKALIQAALVFALGALSPAIQAATPNNGAVLTITPGAEVFDINGSYAGVSSGSWMAADTDGNNAISSVEKVALSQGATGIVIGVATLPGASHPGYPVAGDTNAITAPYAFFGNTASEYTTIGITGSTESGLGMSGWRWAWNGLAPINMGSGAWGAGYSNGIGNFVWDGIYGHAYALDYRATIAPGDPSGIGGFRYAWHFEGVVAVPEASTYGMMLAGLGLVGVVARRRKQNAGY